MCSAASIKFLKLCLDGGAGRGGLTRARNEKGCGKRAGRQEIFNLAPCTKTCTLGSGKGVPLQQMSGRPQESKALLCTAWALSSF